MESKEILSAMQDLMGLLERWNNTMEELRERIKVEECVHRVHY